MRRILIIDNEEYIREIAQVSLETTAGWQVITAASGQEGLIKAESDLPDAILLDVMMPDMDGLTTLKGLLANPATQAIPVLFLTAKVHGLDRQPYDHVGVRATLAKPFNPLELAGQIASVLGWD
jgi:CheY-like chemotaxis protein